MLTSSRVGEILGHTRHTIRRMADRGELPIAKYTPKGQARYKGEDVFDFILKTYTAPTVNLEWGAWLVGFVDGEGCFSIRAADYQPQFSIGLTEGDADVLYEIKHYLGFGEVYHSKEYYNSQGYLCRPRAQFVCSSIPDCLKLVDLFNRFSLRSRKAKDFILWSQFVNLRKVYSMKTKNKEAKANMDSLYHQYRELRQSRKDR